MSTLKLPVVLLSLSLFLAAGVSSGVTGKWSGKIDILDTESGSTISQPVLMTIEEKSGEVSGTIGREGESEAFPIHHARFANGSLEFDATSGETMGPVKFHLTLAGDRMEGEIKGAVDTEDFTGKVSVSRLKD